MSNSGPDYRLGTLDYVAVVAIIVSSSAIGLYYGYQSRNRNTRKFLVSGDNIGVIALVFSSVATSFSAFTFLGGPAEAYTNGFQVALMPVARLCGGLIVMHAILPVFFRLNVNTVNQYIQFRFNRWLRVIPAIVFLLQSTLKMASLSNLTALICSDALGISYWAAMAIICGTCAVYTSMGGFSAVIWTDVLQATVMFVSIGFLVIKGTTSAGGASEIWNRNYEGNRTIMFRSSSDNDTNYSVWSMLVGGALMSIGASCTNQSLVQRQVANKKLFTAKMVTLFTYIISFIIVLTFDWIGLILYANYQGCDPLLNKQIRSRDQMVVLFAKGIYHNADGLFGLYIAALIAASLSTLSSSVNSFCTIVMIDLVKPAFPSLKDKMLTFYSRLVGLLYGIAIVTMTVVVGNLGSIKQLVYMLAGSSVGPSSGMFLLGLLFPWATSTGAACGYAAAICICWWAAIGRSQSRVTHYSLPVNTDACLAKTFDYLNQSVVSAGSNFTEAIHHTTSTESSYILNSLKNQTLLDSRAQAVSDVFALYTLNPLWYYAISALTVLTVGIAVSIATGIQDPETIERGVISPLTWFIIDRLPLKCRKWLGFKSNIIHEDMKLAVNENGCSPISCAETDLDETNPEQQIKNDKV